MHGDLYWTNESGEMMGLSCPICGSGVKPGLEKEAIDTDPIQEELQDTTTDSTWRPLGIIRKLQNAPASSWYGVFIIQYWTFILIQIALYDDPKQAPGFIIITPLAITFSLLLLFMLFRFTKACSNFGILRGIIRGALIVASWTGGVALFFYLSVTTSIYLGAKSSTGMQLILVIMFPITLLAYSPIMYAIHHILRINKLLYDTSTSDSHSLQADSNIIKLNISDLLSASQYIKSRQKPMGVNKGRQLPETENMKPPVADKNRISHN